jgi:hypothetical protein
MVSGPYRSSPTRPGGVADPAERARNLAGLNEAALALFRAGHVPIVGVNVALSLIGAAGEPAFDEIMRPVSLALVDRCDACLRIGGPSTGADQEAARFRAAGRPVYGSLGEVPGAR